MIFKEAVAGEPKVSLLAQTERKEEGIQKKMNKNKWSATKLFNVETWNFLQIIMEPWEYKLGCKNANYLNVYIWGLFQN